MTGTARHPGADPPFPVIQVHINAIAWATGADARGKLISDMTNATGPGRYEGRVTCLSAFGSPFGNEATVGIEIVKASTRVRRPGTALERRGQRPLGHQIAGYPLTPAPPATCPPLFFNVPVVSGNYVIHNAAP